MVAFAEPHHTTERVIQGLKNFLGKYKTILLRRFLPGWRAGDGGGHELAFWGGWIAGKVARPDQDFRFRINPSRRLQEDLEKLLPASECHPGVLDVGCGPLSNIGIRFSLGEVNLTGADPLADAYLGLLQKEGVRPNCKLVACSGEALVATFGKDKFDLVCAMNSLDHSRQPTEVFLNMAGVCKPGGFLYLSHFENEGITERYTGMHQWNLIMKQGRMMVDNGRQTRDFYPEKCGLRMVSAQAKRCGGRTTLEWVLQKHDSPPDSADRI